METFSALLAICAGNSPVNGEFPTKRTGTQIFDVFFDLRPNKRLSKQLWGWWFETPLRSFWRHLNDSQHYADGIFKCFRQTKCCTASNMSLTIVTSSNENILHVTGPLCGNSPVRHWPFVWGIHGSPGNSPHKGQWRGTLMFSLICVWTSGWLNNRHASDLRRHRSHYDVTVMSSS